MCVHACICVHVALEPLLATSGLDIGGRDACCAATSGLDIRGLDASCAAASGAAPVAPAAQALVPRHNSLGWERQHGLSCRQVGAVRAI